MAHDFTHRAPRDRGRINLNEPREVRYWTQALSVSETRLRAAVSAAGDATPAVQQYLGGQVPEQGDLGQSHLASPAATSSSYVQQQQQG